jgi:hypothetical protein
LSEIVDAELLFEIGNCLDVLLKALAVK